MKITHTPLTDGAVFKFWRRQVPSQRLRIARYLNASCWMCQAQSGWPKWQKYHALRGDTALEPKFYVKKRLALPRAASDFSPPEGAEGETHAWPRSRGGEAKDPPAGERWSVTRSPGHHHLHIGGPTEHTTRKILILCASSVEFY